MVCCVVSFVVDSSVVEGFEVVAFVSSDVLVVVVCFFFRCVVVSVTSVSVVSVPLQDGKEDTSIRSASRIAIFLSFIA